MSTSGKERDVLVDTSAAVALVVSTGHAAFETFSVLTRLPPPARRQPEVVARLMATNFPASRFLSPKATAALFSRFADGEIAGGSVYGALVAAAAVEHGLALATLDRRALDTYRVFGVDVEVLSVGRRNDPT